MKKRALKIAPISIIKENTKTMKKIVKILSLILCFVVACTCLTGCFVTYDKEKDFKQVVAKVDSYTIVNPENEDETYQTEEFKFHKYQLANFIASYYESYLNAGYTVDDLIDSIIESVLTQKIVINTAYAYKEFGLIRWSQYEEEDITAYKYQQVDSYLEQMKTKIMEERGETYVSGGITPEDNSSNTSTKYPVYVDDTIVGYESWSKDQLVNECMYYLVPADSTDVVKEEYREKFNDLVPGALIKLLNDYNKSVSYYEGVSSTELQAEATALGISVTGLTDYEVINAIDDYYFNKKQSRNYVVSANRIPGLFGDDKTRSLENNAMDRVLTSVKEETDAFTNVTAEEKQKIADAWATINEIKTTKGISYTYSALAESYIMEHIVGKSYREEVLVGLLEEYIESQIGVSSKEVEDRYASILASQKEAYSDDINNYISDMEKGNMVLYHPVSGYYFIKHILIPFSTEQLADIEEYEGSAIGQQYNNQEEYRNYLATQIVSYEHKDGEDYGEAKSISEIEAEIRKTIAEASYGEKDKAFTKLMYKYSTDTAGFGQKYGYKEKVSFADGEKSSFVPEFAQACADLYAKGDLYVLSDNIVTTYGVHIIMLTKVVDYETETGLYDYATPSDNRTIYQTLENELYDAKLSDFFTKWQNEEIVTNYANSAKVFDEKFENIIEEMSK